MEAVRLAGKGAVAAYSAAGFCRLGLPLLSNQTKPKLIAMSSESLEPSHCGRQSLLLGPSPIGRTA